MKKYYTDWKTIVIVFSVATFGLIALGYGNLSFGKWLRGGIVYLLLMGGLVLLMTRFSYASISGHILKFVYLLFYRRTIDVRDITEINDQPTYKAAKSSFRSVYIFYETRDKAIRYIELRVTVFPENTLGKLIKELKRLNPNIKLNKYCEKLVQSAQ
jgi:hypothetical protein